ncbi:hypothetical protein ASY01nite_24470 [Acetobacter syzygii]|nr:transporter [Acetobacter syzygii]GEL57381.1 hypothetical protein ASY01nite_24470 [Acetobacter syzygii]
MGCNLPVSNMSRNLHIRKIAIFVVVVALTFLSLLVSAGVRTTPGVLMMPLQMELGWSRTTVSSVAAFGIFLYGFVGPFSAALMQSIGIRRTLIGALLLIGVSSGLSLFMTAPWQFFFTWGLLTGLGTGAVAMVFGATVVNRWFVARRGTIMGLLAASTATGSLLFLPVLAGVSGLIAALMALRIGRSPAQSVTRTAA